jgi:hypothetical protein
VKHNIKLVHRVDGQVLDVRQGHNVWVDVGRTWLSKLICYSSFDPVTPETSVRPLHMGLGVGGLGQSDVRVDSPPFSTGYPAGADPNGTDGHQYDREYPIKPGAVVSTLERPVRITGGSTAYPGAPGDRWLTDHTNATRFQVMHRTSMSATFRALFDCTVGELVYAPFTVMLPSEVGLFTSAADLLGNPYCELFAYYTFDTIELGATSQLEIYWRVEFN